ncbi:MAG: cyclopropane-fatty-acyl-phospholipid synthase [Kiritimatiellia bacterium]|jgi:cyclopropane-fatty-acyl-phospholipid synthase
MHHRLSPLEHHFRHACYFYAFDLAELDELDRTVSGFGYNRRQPISLRDADFLERTDESLTTKVYRLLEKQGLSSKTKQVQLITSARYFGYAFNPVSFYLCFDAQRRLHAMIAEVNNTFGEKHVYVLSDFVREGLVMKPRRMEAKVFHVSPFNAIEGEYAFAVRMEDDRLRVDINLHVDGEPVLLTYLSGKRIPLSSSSMWRTTAGLPLRAFLTMPRILLEAAKLHWIKSMKVYTKPHPSSAMTTGRKPRLMEKLYAKVLFGIFNHIEEGQLILEMPDRRTFTFGDPTRGPTQQLQVLNYAFIKRVLTGGPVAFGEAYVDGDIDSEDITGVLELLIANEQIIRASFERVSDFAQKANRALHLSRHNDRKNARENIQAHYDLGNDFYQTFLDPTMTYSSGLFRSESDSMEDAQHNKLQAMIEKADIQAHHHVLEIGSGWGSFAIEAARSTGCRVTSITLSDEQCTLARERVREAGLEDRVEIKICDYRDVEGTFDRVVSIEMLEAVGHEYFGAYFAKIQEVLTPEGRAAIQVITIPDERYEAYRSSCDWIQKYIFPGGLLPSLDILRRSIADARTLVWEGEESLGLHYARTCRGWREAFVAHGDAVTQRGFDTEFQRKWVYYLSYCEAGFTRGYIDVHQLVLTKTSVLEPVGILS